MNPPMPLDDVFLLIQSWLDRLVRRLRLGRAPVPGRKRLLIVQIDGLSRSVLESALAAGRMPFLRRVLQHGGYRLVPMSVGLPTSTPAFQMAAMYGVRPDIPGFHYHDKRRRTDIHFPRAGHAAFVEAAQAAGRPGILQDGSVYGCVFTGGATNDLFSFARLTRPRTPGVVRVLSAVVVVAWVAARSVVLTGGELGRTLVKAIGRPRAGRPTWKEVKKRIAISIWTREWFTLAVARDAYDGVPAIYVNYLDYDETAHALGPASPQALSVLRGVDRSLRRLQRVLRRIPEHRYDLYVLADHGQAASTPYTGMTGGRRFEQAFFDEILAGLRASGRRRVSSVDPAEGVVPRTDAADVADGGRQSFETVRRELGFEPYLDVAESCERDGIRVVSAGPNAFVYFLDAPEPLTLEAIEARWPGLPAALSKSRGIGFVLARAGDGPVCFWRGTRYRLEAREGDLFAGRPDRALVLRELAALMGMPSAGDLVVYGTDAPEGHVSFIDEVGAHAGPSPEELHTFIVAPARAGLPETIGHPLELYELFSRYRLPDAGPVPPSPRDDIVSGRRHRRSRNGARRAIAR